MPSRAATSRCGDHERATPDGQHGTTASIHKRARHRTLTRLRTCQAMTPASVSRALNRARVEAHVETEELAIRSGVGRGEVAAIDAGLPVVVPGAGEFLTDLDRIAASLGLTGSELVEETLAQWAEAFARQMRPSAPTGEPLTAPIKPMESAGPQALAGTTPPYPKTYKQPGSGHRSERRLRTAVLVIATLLVASLAVLAVVDTMGGSGVRVSSPTVSPTRSQRTLLSSTGSSPSGASYTSSIQSLSLSFVSSRQSWVEVTGTKGPPLFAAIVGPGTTSPLNAGLPVTIQIGAGGTKVVVSSDHRTMDLVPPNAPYTYSVSFG